MEYWGSFVIRLFTEVLQGAGYFMRYVTMQNK
jgi:hypothetical protein